MLEFGDITVRFTTNRGVSHELVRHRIGTSFAQESTRYVRYNNDMTFIKPAWWDKTKESSKKIWMSHAERTELMYQALLRDGQRPEQARDVLSHALATQVVVKANAREWRHIFALRCSKQAHPQMRALMTPLLEELQSIYPVIFEELT
jgi:thymidylate synthase (FAD)